MPHPTTTEFLDKLCKHELMPQPLGEWCRKELDCGVAHTLDRLALSAALEAACGIPPMHRRVKTDPCNGALVLARAALASLHHWWDKDKREAHLKKLQAAEKAGELTRLLQCWCAYRETERAKREAEADHHFITA